jgi:hypothetical protein
MPAGRPRKIRDEEGTGMETIETISEDTEMVKEIDGEKAYHIGGNLGYIKPYLGKESLPKGKCTEKTTNDGKKYVVKNFNGEPRYFFVRCVNGAYKLISIMSTGRGKSTRLIKVFKTAKKSTRGKLEKSKIDKLRKAGFPGL